MFELEHRYFVFKIKDVLSFDKKAPSTPNISSILNWCAKRLTKHREDQNKQELNCIVVESDWPEYPMVLEMLRNRIEASKLKLVFTNQQQLPQLGNARLYKTLNGYDADMFHRYEGVIPSKFDRYVTFIGGMAEQFFFDEPSTLGMSPAQIREFLGFLEHVLDSTTKVTFKLKGIHAQDRKPGDWYQQDGKTKVWNGDQRDPEFPVSCTWFQVTRNRSRDSN